MHIDKYRLPILLFGVLLIPCVMALAESDRATERAALPSFRQHALIIGIDEYRAFPNLDHSVRSAMLFADVMRDKFGITPDVLLGERATRAAVLAVLDRYIARLGKQDSLIIFFSGHGAVDPVTGTGYWLAVDSVPGTPGSLIFHKDLLEQYVRRIRAGQLLLICDSPITDGYTRLSKPVDPLTRIEQALYSQSARWILTAPPVTPGQSLDDAKRMKFTQALIDYLSEPSPQLLSAWDLHSALSRRISPSPLVGVVTTRAERASDFLLVKKGVPDGLIPDSVEPGKPGYPPPGPLPDSVTSTAPEYGREYGTLIVHSPRRGWVSLDGGQAYFVEPGRPVRWSKIPVGAYRVEVESEGRSWFRDVDIVKGRTVSLTAELGPVTGERRVVDLGDGIRMEFVWIEPGWFVMGMEDMGRYERPAHRVYIRKGFYMSRYEVSNEHYQRFVLATGYQGAKDCKRDYLRHFDDQSWGNQPSTAPDHPVVYVSWHNAQAFCAWLQTRAGRGWKVRLPTEAEWEYACRAGTTTMYHTGNGRKALEQAGWFEGNSGGNTHPSGRKAANAWGLVDMHGNVSEWCHDTVRIYREGEVHDPIGRDPAPHAARAIRGGSWFDGAEACASAARNYLDPRMSSMMTGFRVILYQDSR